MSSSGSDDEKNITNDSYINILLLGETGVGKSTFINSIANYYTYPNLRAAENEKLFVLIPTNFEMRDKHGKTHTITTGDSDKNEFLRCGVSATQDVKTYVFPLGNGKTIRLIDTPGMGDTRGIKQDDINSENILAYIGQLRELHAICFLFKPSQSRCTVFFKYCMAQILSRLNKSASRNIIFAFTHTRGSDYTPGETISLLQKEIEFIRSKPPHADIPFSSNIFCFDNEPFRYLAAVNVGIEFNRSVRSRNKESWRNSAEQWSKVISYIVGDANNPALQPHYVQSTSAINEARRMITQLQQPLAEISQLISHNMQVLQRHEENLKMDYNSLGELKQKLYIPSVDLEVEEMSAPATVCTSSVCSEVIEKSGRNIWHYKQRCHDPCSLTNITKELVGDPGLVSCAAMRDSNCIECGCNYRVHQHIYYTTTIKEIEEVDSTVEKNINDKQNIVKEAKKIMKKIAKKKEELDNEHSIIVNTSARFAHFLQNNAITPFNDSYKEYIEYLINREQSLNKLCNKDTVKHLRKLLKEYEETKAAFDIALNLKHEPNEITPGDIRASIQDLFQLKHTGKKIKELFQCQTKPRAKEHKNTEYVHKFRFGKSKKADGGAKKNTRQGDGSKKIQGTVMDKSGKTSGAGVRHNLGPDSNAEISGAIEPNYGRKGGNRSNKGPICNLNLLAIETGSRTKTADFEDSDSDSNARNSSATGRNHGGRGGSRSSSNMLAIEPGSNHGGRGGNRSSSNMLAIEPGSRTKTADFEDSDSDSNARNSSATGRNHGGRGGSRSSSNMLAIEPGSRTKTADFEESDSESESESDSESDSEARYHDMLSK